MRIEVMNPKSLTLTDMMDKISELYYLHMSDELGKPVLTPMSIGSVGLLNEDSLLVRIVQSEKQPIVEPEKVKVNAHKHQRVPLTYKLNSNDPKELIFTEFRPVDGSIRVSFKDKDSANVYFDYFREQFCKHANGTDLITVSNIYEDLNQVNWDREECDKWAWPIAHSGHSYITDVRKNKDSSLYGFTLKRPMRVEDITA